MRARSPVLRLGVIACPECGDDAELASAPGPGEPTDEYDCTSCGHQFRRGIPGRCSRPGCLSCRKVVYVVKVLTWTDKPHGHEYQAVYPDRAPIASLQAAMGDLLYLVRQNNGKTYRVFGSDGSVHGGKADHPQAFTIPAADPDAL